MDMIGDLKPNAHLIDGKVPASELPSYVDDILEGTYVNTTTFNDPDGNAYTPETSKIYVDTTTNFTYRWGGSSYARVNEVDLSNYYTKTQVDAKLPVELASGGLYCNYTPTEIKQFAANDRVLFYGAHALNIYDEDSTWVELSYIYDERIHILHVASNKYMTWRYLEAFNYYANVTVDSSTNTVTAISHEGTTISIDDLFLAAGKANVICIVTLGSTYLGEFRLHSKTGTYDASYEVGTYEMNFKCIVEDTLQELIFTREDGAASGSREVTYGLVRIDALTSANEGKVLTIHNSALSWETPSSGTTISYDSTEGRYYFEMEDT